MAVVLRRERGIIPRNGSRGRSLHRRSVRKLQRQTCLHIKRRPQLNLPRRLRGQIRERNLRQQGRYPYRLLRPIHKLRLRTLILNSERIFRRSRIRGRYIRNYATKPIRKRQQPSHLFPPLLRRPVKRLSQKKFVISAENEL